MLVGNIIAALPFMEPDMRELAARAIAKIDALTAEITATAQTLAAHADLATPNE